MTHGELIGSGAEMEDLVQPNLTPPSGVLASKPKEMENEASICEKTNEISSMPLHQTTQPSSSNNSQKTEEESKENESENCEKTRNADKTQIPPPSSTLDSLRLLLRTFCNKPKSPPTLFTSKPIEKEKVIDEGDANNNQNSARLSPSSNKVEASTAKTIPEKISDSGEEIVATCKYALLKPTKLLSESLNQAEVEISVSPKLHVQTNGNGIKDETVFSFPEGDQALEEEAFLHTKKSDNNSRSKRRSSFNKANSKICNSAPLMILKARRRLSQRQATNKLFNCFVLLQRCDYKLHSNSQFKFKQSPNTTDQAKLVTSLEKLKKRLNKKVEEQKKLMDGLQQAATSDSLITHSNVTQPSAPPPVTVATIFSDRWRTTSFVKNRCTDCSKLFPDPLLLHKHALEMHSHLKRKFPCEQCGRSFNNDDELESHIMQIHKTENGKSENSKEKVKSNKIRSYKCSQCDKSFPTYLQRQRHVRSHHQIAKRLLYKCSLCEQTCSSIRLLKLHYMQSHRSAQYRSVQGGN